ncbi:MAG: CBS domain-containing protein [Deltaproteobacteria bacterium]|nr:CBS domain-containing protein [Deltaproteobacteria bacterium]
MKTPAGSTRNEHQPKTGHQGPGKGSDSRLDPYLCLSLADIRLKPPVVVQAGATVLEAARAMLREEAAACLVLRDSETIGILTERDILQKVVAPGKDPAGVLAEEIMGSPLITIRRNDLLFEAFSRMIRHVIRKLVVVDDDLVPVGILEERDLLSAKGENPVYLIGEIAAAKDVATLGQVFRRVGDMAVRSVAEGVGPFQVGRLISDMHDHVLTRVCDLILKELGESPSGFSLLTLGSEGRREQYLATDQDNAMILADDQDRDIRDFFGRFAGQFVQALLDLGFPPCPHQVMVSNPDWRMALDRWMDTVDTAVGRADLNDILTISMLVDMRLVTGDRDLFDRLRDYLFKKIKDNPFLLKYMAREALRFSPPLGFFNNIVVEKSGPRKGLTDIKKGGVFPITQGARTLAAEHVVLETSTEDRVLRLAEMGVFSESLASGLLEACAFFQTLRLRFQTERLRAGESPDNLIAPGRLSSLEQEKLKDCFKIVVEFQGLLSNKYKLHLLT